NTVVFLTSNLGLDVITELCADDEPPPVSAVGTAIRPILSNHFKPALLARMSIVPFMTLKGDALRGIVELKLAKLAKRMKQNNKIALTVSQPAIDTITARCTEVETGARNIDFILKGSILPMLSNTLLARMSDSQTLSAATLDVDGSGQFIATFS